MQLDLTPIEAAALERAADNYNAAHPEDQPLTPAEYLRTVVIGSFVAQHARLPGADFVLRFTGAEIDAIRVAAETDPQIAGFVARTRMPEPLNLASPAFTAAVQYLVAVGLLAQARVEAISALPGAPAVGQG